MNFDKPMAKPNPLIKHKMKLEFLVCTIFVLIFLLTTDYSLISLFWIGIAVGAPFLMEIGLREWFARNPADAEPITGPEDAQIQTLLTGQWDRYHPVATCDKVGSPKITRETIYEKRITESKYVKAEGGYGPDSDDIK